jgi:leucyl aminopeptidase (aminopeptidase T)
MEDLDRALETIVTRCLAIKAGEEIVVVTDPGTEALGLALRAQAEGSGAEASLVLMAERDENGAEPPAVVAAALAAADAFIAPTVKSLSHTRARKAASDAGVRGATLPGVTVPMLARTMACDLDQVQARSRLIAELLDGADEARVTCPRGTDLRLDLTGREGLADDGDLAAPGAFGNLPCGEGFSSPAGGEGVAFATSIAALGIAEEPVELVIADGRLADAAGDMGAALLERLRAPGELGTNLAELGVGTNEAATITGEVLEDEKALGTVHVAFGASAGIGGTVSVPVHLDCVIVEASLEIGGTPVLDAGRLVL